MEWETVVNHFAESSVTNGHESGRTTETLQGRNRRIGKVDARPPSAFPLQRKSPRSGPEPIQRRLAAMVALGTSLSSVELP